MNAIDDEHRSGFVVDHVIVARTLQHAGLGGRCFSNAPFWSHPT